MGFFNWNRSFLTGIADVDDQHFYLVGLINKFGDLLVKNKLTKENLETVFQELYDYTVYHFTEEEGIMRKQETNILISIFVMSQSFF